MKASDFIFVAPNCFKQTKTTIFLKRLGAPYQGQPIEVVKFQMQCRTSAIHTLGNNTWASEEPPDPCNKAAYKRTFFLSSARRP